MKLIIFLLLVALVFSDSCGGNCPWGTCPLCPCSTSPSPVDVTAWCAQSSVWDQTCCQCIVGHQSGGNANYMSYNTTAQINANTFNIGVATINSINWAWCSNTGNAVDLCDPTTNLACAQAVYTAQGWKAWSSHNQCSGCV